MPRAYFNEVDRKIAAFRAWFKGKRAEKGINQEYLARQTKSSQATVSRKIQTRGNQQADISYKDLLIYFQAVNATDEEILRYMKIY